MTGVAPAEERVEQLFQIRLGNAHAVIADAADCGVAVALNVPMHRTAGGGILCRIGQQVREHVLQQTFIAERLLGVFRRGNLERTFGVGGRLQFIHQPSREGQKIQRCGLKIQSPGFRHAQHEHFFHQVRHAPRVLANGLQLFATIFGVELIEVIVENFCRRHDYAEWRAEFVRHHRNEPALELAEFFLAGESFQQLRFGGFALGNVIHRRLNDAFAAPLNARENHFDRNIFAGLAPRNPFKAHVAFGETFLNVLLRKGGGVIAVRLNRRRSFARMQTQQFIGRIVAEHLDDGGIHFEILMFIVQHHALARSFEQRAEFFFRFAQQLFRTCAMRFLQRQRHHRRERGREINFLRRPFARRTNVFVTNHADHFTAHPDRHIKQRGDAKRLEIRFNEA